MSIIQWKGILESLLFAAGDEGLSLKQIMTVLEINEPEAIDIIEDLKQEYENNDDRGILLIEMAGVFQLVTKKEHAPYLKKLVEVPNAHTLSQAALETLAIIAYKQPITRVEIEEIRGVKTERPLQTLTSKALIKEVGRAEGAGRAILYGTTKEFLDYFALKDLQELPPLAEQEEFVQEEADLFFEKFQQTMGESND
ncbi:segregation and condensation protein B [Oikeobacillus pervagus]|uniref:Segregation and condensation protein B n=1 Tax=Oikeobacillus pervagus TaxID=1325931 RepID=A0AAJ1T0K9_9BACI|nr:SMC-Scp complex subunit ScpB [Oikeobacillus pervagus]MDQ0213744.1 segregation and condensation protein B [Oikeobacillus pervagus]